MGILVVTCRHDGNEDRATNGSVHSILPSEFQEICFVRINKIGVASRQCVAQGVQFRHTLVSLTFPTCTNEPPLALSLGVFDVTSANAQRLGRSDVSGV